MTPLPYAWTLIGFALLTGLTGLSLWGIMQRAKTQMEGLVAKQFEEPRIQELLRGVAAQRASALMTEHVTPEVTKFKAEIATQLRELEALVAKTRVLESESRKHEQAIQAVLAGLQRSLTQSQDAHERLTTVKSDIVEMQKCITTIQYYQMKGASTFPNPYVKQMLDALNRLVSIAIPDPAERSKFITELQGPHASEKQ